MAGSWWKNALDTVKEAAEDAVEQASQAAQGSDSALNAQSSGAGAVPASMADAMHPVTLPQRTGTEPAAAASADEAAAALPPIETLATYQDGARRKGWDADNEIVLGEAALDGFVLRRAHDGAAGAAAGILGAASFLAGADDMVDSYARTVTLHAATGQELCVHTPRATSGAVALPDGTPLVEIARSSARDRYTATGVGPLDGLEWFGHPRHRLMKHRRVSAAQRERERDAGVEQFHPWVDGDGGWVMDAKVRRSGAMPVCEIVIGNSLDARERLFAWAVALDYWAVLER